MWVLHNKIRWLSEPPPQETKSSTPEQLRQTENNNKIEITYFNLSSLKQNIYLYCEEISKSSHKSRLINRKFTPYHEYVTTSVPSWLEKLVWNAIIMSHKRMLKRLYKLAHSSAIVGVSNIFKCSNLDVTTYVSARCIISFQFVICE